MKEYSNCFIGISLPSEYLSQFNDLLGKVEGIDPDLKVVGSVTLVPHITICFMDKQSQDNLAAIEEVIKKYIDLLKNSSLTLKGLDTFGDDLPWVLFLPVEYSDNLVEFNSRLTTDLAELMSQDNNLPFHPHMTVAKFSEKSRQSWRVNKDTVNAEMEKINWQFPITEVIVFGVDDIENPGLHQRLFTVKV